MNLKVAERMSGIAGLYMLDGRPVEPTSVSRMVQKMAHRGPDDDGVWNKGSVGLGHCMLHTTPESLHETQPLVGRQGELVLTADVRIDNRDELIRALKSPTSQDRPVTDAELVLAAYEQWGTQCPDQLLGAFAFAIWDQREQRLFCARDHVGVKPFYFYHDPGHLFAFGSEIKALLVLDQVETTLHRGEVVNYLAGVYDDRRHTIYDEICRLPPANRMEVEADRCTEREYWRLDSDKKIRFESDEDYAAAFSSIFTDAVDCRLRSIGPVGSFLSGGLDSSSIAVTAQDLLSKREQGPLHTFSAIYEGLPRCDEQMYIREVLRHGTYKSHFLSGQDVPLFDTLKDMLHALDEPFQVANNAVSWTLNREVTESGVRVVFDGHGGDEVVSKGTGRLKELAASNRWLTLANELRLLSKGEPDIHGKEVVQEILYYLRRYSVWSKVKDTSWASQLRRVYRFLAPQRAGNTGGGSIGWRDIINPDLYEQSNVESRYQRQSERIGHHAESETTRHFKHVTHPLMAYGFELHDAQNSAFGIEGRYPFWDKRLLEFTTALPSDQKLRNGWNRFILRNALSDRLPETVRWRRSKVDYYPNIVQGLRAQKPKVEDLLSEDVELISEFVSTSKAQRLFHRCMSTDASRRSELSALLKVVALTLWCSSRI
jgi:asparagine synthase (glutamine-hydrolysing)